MELSIGDEVQFKHKNESECTWNTVAKINRKTIDLDRCGNQSFRVRVPIVGVHKEFCRDCT